MRVGGDSGARCVPRPCFFALPAATLIFSLFLSGPAIVIAKERNGLATENSIEIYLLREQHCDGCDRAQAFLGMVAEKDEWITVTPMDMETSKLAKALYTKLLELFSVPALEFPVTIVGTHAVTGYVDDRTTGIEILGHAQFCRWFDCDDMVEALELNGETIIEVKSRQSVPYESCFTVTWNERKVCTLKTE
ncbi:MAG: hypothetical protein ACR2O4_14655 [Hyphomicrobiaceae bacterium]